MPTPLSLSRSQILRYRRQASSLDLRMPASATSLRRAAWAGSQDSMPRAALLSIHARVAATRLDTWQHPSLVQVWGPRYNDYVVSAKDRALFTLGRLPQDVRVRARAQQTANELKRFLGGRRMPFGQAGRAMGVPHNSLRYATLTGTVQLHWDGAHQPLIWTVPAPTIDAGRARLELARRFVHVFGPTRAESFARWVGVNIKEAETTLATLARELLPVRTPIGKAWILAADEGLYRARKQKMAGVRFLPSGDTYFLLWGADRALLVPQAKPRAALWTTRVWPCALLLDGEIVGTWRRPGGVVAIDAWRRFSRAERKCVDMEIAALPL